MRSPRCWVPPEHGQSTDPPASGPRDRRSSGGRRVERITVHARPPASDPIRSVSRHRSDGQRERASSVESPKVTGGKLDRAIEGEKTARNGQSGQRRRYPRAIPASQRGVSPAEEPSSPPRRREIGTRRAPHGAESALSRRETPSSPCRGGNRRPRSSGRAGRHTAM